MLVEIGGELITLYRAFETLYSIISATVWSYRQHRQFKLIYNYRFDIFEISSMHKKEKTTNSTIEKEKKIIVVEIDFDRFAC